MEKTETADRKVGTRRDGHRDRCMICGQPTTVSLCSLSCRAQARAETEGNLARIDRLRELGFDVRLDEVQAVVRRNLQLARALDDPALVDVGAAS